MVEQIYGKQFEYPEGLGKYLIETKFLNAYLENGIKLFDKEIFVMIRPNTLLETLLTEMQEYADHCEWHDFLKSSKAVEKMQKITQAATDFRNMAMEEQDSIRDMQLSNLREIADSQVTGLDFGIISNSIVSHLLYSSMNDSKKRKQKEEADRFYNKEADNIYMQSIDDFGERVYNFDRQYFEPILKQGLEEFYYEAYSRYMRILNKTGEFNLEAINDAEYDIEASDRILSKHNTELNIEDTVYTALCLCPYNTKVYEFAYKNNVLTDKLYMLSIQLKLGISDSMEANYVDDVSIQEIAQSLTNGVFPMSHIVPILDKNLIDIDDNIVALFNEFPKEIKDFALTEIVKHLELEKKTSILNNYLISDDIISFLENAKKLYSSEIATFGKLINETYKEEIVRICKPFEEMLRISKNPEALSAYARKTAVCKEIEILDFEIENFIKYYKVFNTDKMQKIIDLVGGTEVSLFKNYIVTLNKRIKEEYKKYREAERERQEKEAQLEIERREREEKHRQEIEAKKHSIQAEINALNKELEKIGFAIFGKRAHRKTELKELRIKKQNELNNLK